MAGEVYLCLHSSGRFLTPPKTWNIQYINLETIACAETPIGFFKLVQVVVITNHKSLINLWPKLKGFSMEKINSPIASANGFFDCSNSPKGRLIK